MINNDSNSWGLCNISKAKLTYVGLLMFPMINNDSNSWGLCNISKAKLTYVGLFVEMIYLLFVVITGFPPKKLGF
jgi:hypothetical protein